MRWMVVAAVVAYSMGGILPAATRADEAPSMIDMSESAPGVAVSAIPSPPPVIEVLKLEDPVARARSAKKLRLAKKQEAPTLMLTRTERRQMALLVVVDSKAGDTLGHMYNPDDNSQGGLDQLDLHRFFSRPRVADEARDEAGNEAGDSLADADGFSPHVRLRLLMARLKAVEAYAVKQVVDNDEQPLPETIRLRLQEARLKAVAAHQRKFA